MVAVSLKKKKSDVVAATYKLRSQLDYGMFLPIQHAVFFFKQKTAYEIGLGIPAEPLFRS